MVKQFAVGEHRLREDFEDVAIVGDTFYLVNSRGTLDSGAGYKSDWANELHPTASGFDQIVDEKWIPVLQERGIANT